MVVVVTFAGTTMDTGVRLQRYILEEIAELAGFNGLVGRINMLTTLAVLIPLALALVPGGDGAGGKGFAFGQLWTLFGTTNQLTAGLALSVISVWVMSRNRNPLAAIVPLTFLLFMTSWALVLNLVSFLREGSWMLLIMDAAIFVLAAWLIVEAITAFNRQRGERRVGDRGHEPRRRSSADPRSRAGCPAQRFGLLWAAGRGHSVLGRAADFGHSRR